ncbi:MAG: enoyl-CoA hydratase/isomerase family protein [Colwellia sp.]|nr:enoyl-CoA hydratase/isomerase family protein [Colwellia sp.]
MDNLIITQENNHVLTITLNRINKKNALNKSMYLDLCSAFKDASENSNIHCVLIQGDENCFCAGNDLADFLQSTQSDDLAAFDFVQVLTSFEKPIVAAVAGPAVGIGTTMLLHCDMVVAATNSKFKLPFTQLGISPEAGSSLLLPLRIGHAKAFELLVLGKLFTAEQALEYGLINQVCLPEELLAIAADIADTIAKLPHDSVMTSRKLMKQSTQAVMPQVIANEAHEFKRLVQTDECKNILAKFF